MSVEVREATDEDRERWNDLVERSPQGTVFHRLETLEVVADHADATLHLLLGYVGQEPVGLFPVFEAGVGPLRTAFSPPPDLRVPYMGPVTLNMAKLKRRKTDRRHARFLEGCLDWIDAEIAPHYGHLRTAPRVCDLRPFTWNGHTAQPRYTYRVDLDRDPEDVMSTFSSDARRNVRNANDDDYEIVEGGPAAIDRIVEQVQRRYESQGVDYRVPTEFVRDLHERLPDGSLRPYELRVDGEFVGGMLATEDDRAIYRWQGGVRTDTDVDLAVNDLLDWRLIEDGIERGLDAYDLVGADDRRINEYKSKFGPDLRTYYSVERDGVWRRVAHLYRKVR